MDPSTINQADMDAAHALLAMRNSTHPSVPAQPTSTLLTTSGKPVTAKTHCENQNNGMTPDAQRPEVESIDGSAPSSASEYHDSNVALSAHSDERQDDEHGPATELALPALKWEGHPALTKRKMSLEEYLVKEKEWMKRRDEGKE